MKKFSIISIVLSSISIACILFDNYKLAELYTESDGKTRALFGFIELVHFENKLYFGLISLIGLTFGLIAVRKKEDVSLTLTAIAIAVLSFPFLFIRWWSYFV